MTNISYTLAELGFNEELRKQVCSKEENYTVARIAVEYRNFYKLYGEQGEQMATLSGKMIYEAEEREDYPAVGDWVLISKGTCYGDRTIIHEILKRKSKLARKEAGSTPKEQVIAANIDVTFLCMSLNENYNLRRLERYITMTFDSGSMPVVLLTKSDLCHDIERLVEEVQAVAPGVDVICISALKEEGLDLVKSYIKEGVTVAFLGSSGVGKSTIINALLGEERQATMETSELGARGRHTTTNRELMILPQGGIVIDTPGMRELHIMDVGESLNAAFKEIEEAAKHCRFADCSHGKEPGCAVKRAVEEGTITEERLNSYMKLKKEAQHMERKSKLKARTENKKSHKKKDKGESFKAIRV